MRRRWKGRDNDFINGPLTYQEKMDKEWRNRYEVVFTTLDYGAYIVLALCCAYIAVYMKYIAP